MLKVWKVQSGYSIENVWKVLGWLVGYDFQCYQSAMNFQQSPRYFGRLQAGLWQGQWRSLTRFTQHVQKPTANPRLASFGLLSLKLTFSFSKGTMRYYRRYLDAEVQVAFWLLLKVNLILWKWNWIADCENTRRLWMESWCIEENVLLFTGNWGKTLWAKRDVFSTY